MTKSQEMIDKRAVLHIPLSQYAFAESEYGLTIRLRVKKGDLSECFLFYADRVCKKTPVEFTELQMYVCGKDEYFEYYEARVESPYNRICYYFQLVKGKEWTYYYADRFTRQLADFSLDGHIVDGRSAYYQYPFILRNEIPDVPEWFKSARVYNIFPDSFASGKRVLEKGVREVCLEDGRICRAKHGGTIKGITENIDYIQEMGFTCIYLNPIFAGGEYHKYDVLDYYHVDPCMGTEEDFRELVEKLHERGMKIIIDGVFNHCSWEFFAFADVVEKGRNSRYCKWFYKLEFPVKKPKTQEEIPGYACFAYERKMPKLNTTEKEVQMYFADVGAYWIREYHVDGWRLDVANEIDRNFWRRFRAAVKKENPHAVLIGEVWENAETWLRGDAFDSVMNYEFCRICKEYLAAEKPDALKTSYQFEQMRLRYPTNIVNGQMNLLDSHDIPRFLSLCRGNIARWKLGCILLMLMPGVPSLFYGDEQEIRGITEAEYRQPMKWEERGSQCGFIAKLNQIRELCIDSKTDYQPKWKLIDDSLFVFGRKNEKGEMVVYINTGEEKQIRMPEKGRPLLQEGYHQEKLLENGYVIWHIQ
ncbi:MAG: glycoside hydrolase family 13 protein [Roseburia sp.]|nr:glycoside hydrolase family 13 protein [Roseburia sp.]MCM1278948.1 glycoside hydrolase family 13 protein [Robinsoniella sp.]